MPALNMGPGTITNAGIWINVECNIGIVSACLPVMWPLLKRLPSLPKSVTSRLTALFSSNRSQKLPSNKSNSTDHTAVNPYDDKFTENKSDEPEDGYWPRPSDGAVSMGSTKHLTYRSEAEGYGSGSMGDIEMLGANKEYKTSQNEAAWIDETGREQPLYPTKYPTAVLKY